MGAIEETNGCKMGAVHKTEGNGSASNGSYRKKLKGVKWELCTKQRGTEAL